MRRALAWAVAAGALGMFVPGPADACHNGVVYELDQDVRQVMVAERQVDSGRPDRGLRAAHLAAERMRRSAPAAGRSTIRRAQQVMAVAVVRLEGRVDLTRKVAVRTTSEPQRRSNLRWARDLLAGLRRGGSDPVLDARYAESVAALGENTTDARDMLRAMSTRDLMPDAWAYRALAELERLAGEQSRVEDALTHCAQRAGPTLRGLICELPEASARS